MFDQPAVLITGAANGIGAEIARRFAKEGWFIGVSDLDANAVRELVSELGEDRSMGLSLDVTSEDQWQSALESFEQRTGRLDLLVNNAGVLFSGRFETIPLAKQLLLMDVNVKGVVTGCYKAFPYLKKTASSRVINLASASAIYGQPSLAAYSSSKFAVRGLTEALNIEWEDHDITVMDMMPLFVSTAMVKDMDAQSISKLGVKLTPTDVANAVWKAANSGRKRQIHWPVGLDTQILYRFSGFMPDWVSRSINRWIGWSGHD